MRGERRIEVWPFPGGDGKLVSALWGEASGLTVTAMLSNTPTKRPDFLCPTPTHTALKKTVATVT